MKNLQEKARDIINSGNWGCTSKNDNNGAQKHIDYLNTPHCSIRSVETKIKENWSKILERGRDEKTNHADFPMLAAQFIADQIAKERTTHFNWFLDSSVVFILN